MSHDEFFAGAESERRRIRRTVGQMVKNLRSLVEVRCRNPNAPCRLCGPCCARYSLDRIDAVTLSAKPKRGAK